MKVFISWSGTKSRQVAVALRDWLPQVVNVVQPFVSSEDIHAGTRWQMEIAAQLDSTNFGLVCVTKENQRAPWLNFEAGALAKAVDSSRLVPIAVDLKPTDIEAPLGQFQGKPASEEGITEILASINSVCPTPLADALLNKSAKMWWPELQAKLEDIEKNNSLVRGRNSIGRTDRELLEEMLDTVRSLARPRTAGSGAASRDSRLPRDHPLIAELSAMLENSLDGETARILVGSSRRLGVRYNGTVPSDMRDLLKRTADLYAVELDFLPPSRSGLGRGVGSLVSSVDAESAIDSDDPPR